MISSDYSFRHFVESMSGKNHQEIICLAEKEATEAWRSSYRKQNGSGEWLRSKSYQDRLIGLIDFMRHGVRTYRFEENELRLCRALCEDSPPLQGARQT
jgi:hypothetical protein